LANGLLDCLSAAIRAPSLLLERVIAVNIQAFTKVINAGVIHRDLAIHVRRDVVNGQGPVAWLTISSGLIGPQGR